MVELSLFRLFVPTYVLPPQERAELARHSTLTRYEPGKVAFRRGMNSPIAAFLVEGEIELEDASGRRRITAGTEDARHALSNAEQFVCTATCIRPATLLLVNRAKLDYVLTWAQSGTIEVHDIGGGDAEDWMGTMLQCPSMQLIPPANIARIISRVEPVQADAGDMLIEQGAPGDSYYVLTAGRCSVLRSEERGSEPNIIGTLLPGQGFGEEALLSGEPRNATIRADTECRLVRLSGDDFGELLQAPMLRRVDIDAAPARALRIDVRLPEEFAHGHVPGAVNVPLRDIRERCAGLEQARPLVVYCDGGRRSASATFLLCERGFDASWVPDGVPPEKLTEQSTAA